MTLARVWQVLSSTEGFSTKLFRVVVKQVLSPRTGKPLEFYTIEAADWVGVIPLLDEEVVMVRQYRHGIEDWCLEIPGGIVDDELPQEAARRELKEETGYEAQELELLGVLRPQPALFNNRFFVFLAKGLKWTGEQRLEEGEDLEVVKVSLRDLGEVISSGQIDHALVLASFELLRLRHPELLR